MKEQDRVRVAVIGEAEANELCRGHAANHVVERAAQPGEGHNNGLATNAHRGAPMLHSIDSVADQGVGQDQAA